MHLKVNYSSKIGIDYDIQASRNSKKSWVAIPVLMHFGLNSISSRTRRILFNGTCHNSVNM
jgi:hypothetical protein